LGHLVVGFLLHACSHEHLDYNGQIATRMSSIEHKECVGLSSRNQQAFRTSPWRAEQRQKEG
jgi:hypothetical protein